MCGRGFWTWDFVADWGKSLALPGTSVGEDEYSGQNFDWDDEFQCWGQWSRAGKHVMQP